MGKIKKITIFLIITVSVLLITNAVVLKVTNKNILETTGKIFKIIAGGTLENKTIEFESKDYGDPGTWKITENVKWIDSNKLEITYNLTSVIETYNKNKDVILMIDTSGSMFGDKLQTLKDNSIELLDTLLEVETNKIALIEFNTTSNIIQEFTNDKETLINKINSMNANGGTNYNQALQNLDTILDSYNKESNRDLVVMFLTDGYPVEENPSQKATYQILKSKYDYLEINGIQYEMGETLKQEVKDITDRQYTANINNLSNVLLKVLVSSKKYDEFKIEKQISDYFEIIDATTTNGNITIDSYNTKVICDMNKSYLAGSKEKITIIAKLKEEYQTQMNDYKVNENFKVNYKISDVEEEYQSGKTPVIANAYDVKYVLNKPSGCNLESIDTTKHLVYSNVEISQNKLKCEGYLFKGFKIVNNNVTKMNDDTFIMPGEDVTISAEWTKLSLSKTMDGTIIKEKTTLYQAIANQENTLTKKYVGEHKDSFTQAATHDIYYYYAPDDTTATEILDSNNVIFANHCWQMIRTTDTGGVKLIYNGEPDSNGSCGTNRSTHVGYSGVSTQTLSSSYYYATDYTYDSSTNTFSLNGTKTLATWSRSTYSDLVGKYTCLSVEENGTCTTLYLVESYVSSTQAIAIKIVSTSSYSQLGTLQFNSNYNSPAYVGYMYGDVYTYSTIRDTNIINYHYGESVTYDGEKYTLVNPKTFTTTPLYADISNNHYICLTRNSDTCHKVGYVYFYSAAMMYYITLNVGETEVNTALNNMFTKNTTSSTMKNAIDAWYEKYLLEYDEYIEQDAIYSNDRSIEALNGWNPNGGLVNGGSIQAYLKFKEYNVTQDLSCTNNTDKFSVSNTAAKLKYPIGLSTAPEMNLLNNKNVRKTGNNYWLGSPIYFNNGSAYVRSVDNNSYINSSDVDNLYVGVRPVISLISGTEYVSGDGSADNPYIVE